MIGCTTSRWLFDSRAKYVLEKQLTEIDDSTITPEEIISYRKHYDDTTKVACIMVATMAPRLQRFYEDYWPYKTSLDLVENFHMSACQENYEVVKSLMA